MRQEVRGSRGRLQYSVAAGRWSRVPDVGFQVVDLTQPPPGYLMHQVPKINSMNQFPVLKTPQNLSNTM